MDTKNITGSSYMVWQSQLQQCQTDASVFKSSLQDVKQRRKKATRTVEQCGQGCPSQPYVAISQLMTKCHLEWKPTSPNRGTVHHTTTQLCPLTGVNLAPGWRKLQVNFIQQDTYLPWTTPKAKLQTVQPNTNRVTLWC